MKIYQVGTESQNVLKRKLVKLQILHFLHNKQENVSRDDHVLCHIVL